MTPADVHSSCLTFLERMFGKKGHPPNTELGLRLVCLGNAEKTVQGELLSHLRHAALESGSHAVAECGASFPAGGGRLNRDITIFDAQWRPTCILEMKHFSANQGPAAVLLQNMELDRLRYNNSPLGGVTLIRIGLFTEVQERGELGLEHGLYRFLRTYFDGLPDPWFASAPAEIVKTEPIQFAVGACSVTMRVGYCMM